MTINVLRDTVPWFGKYSGYEGLVGYFSKSVQVTITDRKEDLIKKIFGKVYQIYKGRFDKSPVEIFAELMFIQKIGENDISHVLYLDGHLDGVKSIQRGRDKLIGTIHLPISEWNNEKLQKLESVENVIILYNEEIGVFSKFIDIKKIHFIRHGVDISFFKPGDRLLVKKNKILFVGHFLRNFEMFSEVYQLIQNKTNERIEFHFIIPSFHRNKGPIQKIQQLNNIFFHEGLSDEGLLEFYQTSYLLLMPMSDSGANTAIVQAIATGLPVITTDVGGVRSYGGGDIFPLIKNDDSQSMAELFLQYYNNEVFRNDISEKQRRFAVDHLDWNLIAAQHVEVYEQVKVLHNGL